MIIITWTINWSSFFWPIPAALLLKYLPRGCPDRTQHGGGDDVCINLPTISDPFGCIIININIVIDTNRSTGQSCHDNYPIMMQSIMHQLQPWGAFSTRRCMKERKRQRTIQFSLKDPWNFHPDISLDKSYKKLINKFLTVPPPGLLVYIK